MHASAATQTQRHARLVVPLLWFPLIVLCGCLSRCLHLADAGHHYLLSPDSYFFHWQAERALEGETIPLNWHGGLTYPLCYAAKAIARVGGMSDSSALRLSELALPVVLACITIVILYIFVAKTLSKRTAVLAALVWAVALMPVFIQCAGYIDRDGLSVLLVMGGVLIFHDSGTWDIRIAGLNVGRVFGILSLLLMEAVLYAQWVFIGPVILLAVLIGLWIAEVVLIVGKSLLDSLARGQADVLTEVWLWLRSVPSALWRSDWRPLVVVLLINALVLAVRPGPGYIYDQLRDLSRAALMGSASVAELEGLGLPDLLAYQFFGIAALLGAYSALKNGRRSDCLLLGWAGSLFALALLSRRVLLMAAPAISVLAAMGLASLLEVQGLRFSWARIEAALLYDRVMLRRYLLAGLGVALLSVSLLLSVPMAWAVGSNGYVSANAEWQAGMSWLREDTPQEAVVMSHWNAGYYILGLGHRRPVVDNGFYGWDDARNHDIATAYCSDNALHAVAIMEKYGADYLVFSTLEYAILPKITRDALGESYGDGKSIPRELADSIYARALSGEQLPGGTLRRVWPDTPETGPVPLVILQIDRL